MTRNTLLPSKPIQEKNDDLCDAASHTDQVVSSHMKCTWDLSVFDRFEDTATVGS